MTLVRYIARRIAYFIPVLFGSIILSFLVIRLAPGDPVSILAGESASLQYREMVMHNYGLDKPLYEQLLIYILNVLQGNLGNSYVWKEPVLNAILRRLPATVLLVGCGLTIAVILGLIAGVVSGTKPNSLTDNAVMSFAVVGYSVPVFWTAQLFVLTLAVYLRLFPVTGLYSVGSSFSFSYAGVADVLWHLALPVATLSIYFMAVYARLTRTSMLMTMRENFIITARAKGVKEHDVVYKHALRNSLLPVVTSLGVQFGVMIAGVVLTETVYAWPGMGSLLTDAVFYRDYPLVTGIFIFVTITVIVANLVTDLVYTILDPRIRYD